MRVTGFTFYAAVASASLVAAGCFGSSGAGPSDAQQTIERFVEAIDERDGEEVCSLFSDDVRERYDSAAEEAAYEEDLDCAKILSGFIGYVEDSGIPKWKGVRLEGDPRVTVDGDEARASFYVTHQIEDYDAAADEEIVAPVRQADVVDLVREGADWKLASTGQTLRQAGPGTFFPTVDPAETDATDVAAAEAFARDYVLILSGAPIEPCRVVPPQGPTSGGGCDEGHSVSARYSQASEGPIWQAAEIDGVSAEVAGERAVVSLELTETYLSAEDGAYELSTRPLEDELVLTRGDDGWGLDEPSRLYYHATGMPPPAESAESLPRGVPLFEDESLRCEFGGEPAAGCPGQVVITRGPGTGLAFWFALADEGTLELRSRVLEGVHPQGAPTTLKRFQLPDTPGRSGPQYLVAAQNRASGDALVAWSTSAHKNTRTPDGLSQEGYARPLYVLPVSADGRAAGRVRRFAAPTPSLELPLLALGDDPRTERFLAVWHEADLEGGGARVVSVRLDPRGQPLGQPREVFSETFESTPTVAAAPGGGWLVAGANPGLPDNPVVPASSSMAIAKVDTAGRARRGFSVTTDRQISPPALALAPDGEAALAAWAVGSDRTNTAHVVARRLGAAGEAAGPQIALSGEINTQFSTTSSTLVDLATAKDGYVAAWTVTPLRDLPTEFTYRDLTAAGQPTGPERTSRLDRRAGEGAGLISGPPAILMRRDPARGGEIYLAPLDR